MMALLGAVISFIILGILYRKMIRWGRPPAISKRQAVVPVVLGVFSLLISFAFVLLNWAVANGVGYDYEAAHVAVQSFVSAFLSAGLPEEFAKLLMILISIRIFRKRIGNVYEYILVGAAVGFGFTIFEEFLYGSDLISMILRLITVTGHMLFGICMARHLGMAKYDKETGKGAAAKEYILAFVVPVVLHTAYDALVMNKLKESGDENIQLVGVCIALAAVVFMFALQIIMLVKLKKNAGKLSALAFIPS